MKKVTVFMVKEEGGTYAFSNTEFNLELIKGMMGWLGKDYVGGFKVVEKPKKGKKK